MLSTETFAAMGTWNTVVVEDQAALPGAAAIVKGQIREIDETCSRFKPDSELSLLNRQAGGGPVALSPLLEEAIAAALSAAAMTGGLVDPTVGRSVEAIGYTVSFRGLPADGPAVELRVRPAPGWRSLEHDPAAHTLRLPEGVSIDLGASGKAWAADRAAGAVAERLGVPVVVECGGDVAARGPAPRGGWPVRVSAADGGLDFQDVSLFDGGLATSGVGARRWRRGGVELHHIIDPATGLPAQTPWAAVTVAAASCLEANAAATAALIMGERAVEWLDGLHLPARLVDAGGGVHHAGGWSA